MDNQRDSQYRSRDFELGVRNVKVFTRHTEIMGLPSTVFLVGGAICGIILALYKFAWWAWLAAFIAAGLYYPFMYLYHREDPRGYLVILAALKEKSNIWSAGQANPRQLEIID